jgi:hypothetical protein
MTVDFFVSCRLQRERMSRTRDDTMSAADPVNRYLDETQRFGFL